MRVAQGRPKYTGRHPQILCYTKGRLPVDKTRRKKGVHGIEGGRPSPQKVLVVIAASSLRKLSHGDRALNLRSTEKRERLNESSAKRQLTRMAAYQEDLCQHFMGRREKTAKNVRESNPLLKQNENRNHLRKKLGSRGSHLFTRGPTNTPKKSSREKN